MDSVHPAFASSKSFVVAEDATHSWRPPSCVECDVRLGGAGRIDTARLRQDREALPSAGLLGLRPDNRRPTRSVDAAVDLLLRHTSTRLILAGKLTAPTLTSHPGPHL